MSNLLSGKLHISGVMVRMQ